jgi:homocitrate synthase NifV
VAANKSVVGEGVFTHEAGIHVDGLLKDPANYQGIDPALLGRSHRMLLGKHSGGHAVRAAFASMGFVLSRDETQALLLRIRSHASETKRPPTPAELRRFYLEASTPVGAQS